MLPFRLTCLGPPQLVGPDGDPVRFRTRKHLGLLVFLAIEPPVAHRRDRLATLLWPQVELEEGRHSLATALSVLRGRLGADAFETGRDTIRLLPGRVVSDVALLAAGDELEGDTLVAGAFLDDFEIPRAPDFQHWIDTERARLLPLVHDHLASRIGQSRRSGDTRRLEATAEQLLRIDPLSEEATRAQVEARAMAGDRIGALRIFDRWRERLAEEFGATPGPEMQRMADRLRRRGVERVELARVAPVPTEQWQERLFVGRSAEFRDCYQAWERVRTGEPRHVLVRGESGVGKSTLVGRVATSLALEGASIARVQCYELERELPFGVIGSLVNHLLDLPGASAAAPAHLAELGRLVAKVRQRWPGLPEPSSATGESARIQFTEAVMALLTALAEEQPVVLVIDDLHLADATSLAVIHLLLRRIESLPLMAMLTLTTGQELPPAASRFTERPEAIRAGLLDLAPLPESHAAELLEAMLAGAADPGPTVRRAILSGAAGNPMILELLAGDWRRRGDGSLALALSAMTTEAARPAAIGFARLTEGVLGSLDRETRAVADLAAILGQRLNDLSMYTLVDLPVARTMRAMATLTSQRLLRDANSHLEFANELVRGHCYLAMPSPLRRMLHSLVADRLIADLGNEQAISGLEIAWHLVRGNRIEEATPFLLSGGGEAIQRGAPHEADLALSTGLPSLHGAARSTATLLLAEALQELGRWNESLRVLQFVSAPAEQTEAHWREVLETAAKRWIGALGSEQAVHAIARLCSIADSTRSPTVSVRALSTVPYLLSHTRDEASAACFHQALTRFRLDDLSPYERNQFDLAYAWSFERRGDGLRARQILDGALARVEEYGFADSTAVRVYVGAAAVRLGAGEYQDAKPFLERAIGLSTNLDNSVHVATVATSLAIVHGRLGEYSVQIEWANKALDRLSADDPSMTSLGASYEKGLGLAFEGRDAEALSVVAQLDRKSGRGSPAWAVQASRLMKADILALTGQPARAMACARRALDASTDGPLIIDIAGVYARWTAILGISTGELQTAADLIRDRILDLRPLHARDRAEALASLSALESRQGIDGGPTRDQLEEEMSRLPPSAMGVARRLVGLMVSDGQSGGWGVR